MYWKGFEIVRGNATQFTKNSERGLFNLLGKMANKHREIDQDKVISFLKNQKRFLMDGRFNESLVFRTSTKEDGKYMSITPHVRAARKLDKMGLFTWGQKIEYVITEIISGSPHSEPLIRGEIPKIKKSGLDYYWNSAFFNYVEPILKMVTDIVDVKRQVGGQQTLFDFNYNDVPESLKVAKPPNWKMKPSKAKALFTFME